MLAHIYNSTVTFEHWDGDYWIKNSVYYKRPIVSKIPLVGAMSLARQHWYARVGRYKKVRNVRISVKYTEAEWWLEWFCHATLDIGQSDLEVLTSFRKYIHWAERQGHRRLDTTFSVPVIELMGAEETWRWRGENDGPAPCRCAGCKKSGLIRINH